MTTAPTTTEAPRFRVGFDGLTEYTWRGKSYECRHHEAHTSREPDHRLIGCVWCSSSAGRGEFPPPELMEHFPGYVRAAYVPTGETYPVKWTGGTLTVDRCEWQFDGEPRQEETRLGLRATAWGDEYRALGFND